MKKIIMKGISIGIPVVIRADFTAAGDQLGCKALISATIPEIWGVDIEVPESMAYSPSIDGLWGEVAANMWTPGAVISGCSTQK